MGPGGKGGGVHEVRRGRTGGLWCKRDQRNSRETIITSDNDSYYSQRRKLILQNLHAVNSGQVLRDG